MWHVSMALKHCVSSKEWAAAYVSDTYYSPIIIGPTILAICSIRTFLDLCSRRSGYSPRFWECRRQQSASTSNSDELGTKQSATSLLTKICRWHTSSLQSSSPIASVVRDVNGSGGCVAVSDVWCSKGLGFSTDAVSMILRGGIFRRRVAKSTWTRTVRTKQR